MVIESAHRLIAVSLGKIASSRNQRGGVRLHRSLLVAGVLMNARTATILYHDDEYSDDQETATEVNDMDVAEIGEKAAIACSPLTPLLPSASDEWRLCADDGPEGVPQDAAGKSALNCVLPDVTTAPVEPTTEKDTINRISDSVAAVVDCERKRKRLGSDDEIEEYSENKRPRFVAESAVSSPSLQATVADTSSDTAGDEMEIESMQLSSLVQCFNSGFQGLLTNSENSSPFAYTLDTAMDDKRHTSTSESIISCSVHIREALETLSRPVLAMSV